MSLPHAARNVLGKSLSLSAGAMRAKPAVDDTPQAHKLDVQHSACAKCTPCVKIIVGMSNIIFMRKYMTNWDNSVYRRAWVWEAAFDFQQGRPDGLWDPHNFLCNSYRKFFPQDKVIGA